MSHELFSNKTVKDAFFSTKTKSYEDWFQRCFFFRKKTHCWCYFNLVPTKLSKILCFLPTTKNFWGFQSCFSFNQLYFFSGQLSIVVRFFTLYKENLLFYLDVCFKNKEKKFVIFLSSRPGRDLGRERGAISPLAWNILWKVENNYRRRWSCATPAPAMVAPHTPGPGRDG